MTLVKNKFSEEFIMINIIRNEVNVKNEEGYEEKNIYTIVGIDLLGNRNILNIRLEKKDTRFFLDTFEQLKSKGIKNIAFVVAEEDRQLIKCLKISYPNTVFVKSFTMSIMKLWKWVSFKGRGILISKIKAFYVQNDYETASELIKDFNKDYQDNQLLINLFNRCFNDIERYYKYDKIVREFLFNHNSFTDIHYAVKAVSKGKIYDDINVLKEEIRSKISKIETNRLYNKKVWLTIINHCNNYFNGIIEKVVAEI